MKLVINGLRIELKGVASACYDAHTDELTVQNSATKLLRIAGPKEVSPKRASKQTELREQVLQLLADRAPEPVYKIGMTKALLGYPAAPDKSKYLHLLLTEMVDEGVITRSDHNRSAVYGLPQN